MSSEHTPGPWYVGPDLFEFSGDTYVFCEDNHYVASTNGGLHDRPTREANARLIAATPDMLRAMRHAFDCIAFPVSTGIDPRGYSLHHESERLAYAAEVLSATLSKAEGRS